MKQFYAQCEGNQEIIDWIDTVVKARDNIDVTEVEHIIDYLKSDKAPTRLRKASYDQMLKATGAWTESMIKKGLHLKDKETDIETVFDFKDGTTLVKLLTQDAYLREGTLMRHCLGAYNVEDGREIFSLRDVENMPHCTFEVSKSINQIKGKGNGPIHPRYINYILIIIEHVFKQPLRDSELIHLGYISVTSDLVDYFDTHFSGHNLMTIKGNQYLYINSDINLKNK